jgi:hypothetical protein
MSDWTDGYRAALADVARLARSRGDESLPGILVDLECDAMVIEREADNRLRRRRLTAAREATLFDELPP